MVIPDGRIQLGPLPDTRESPILSSIIQHHSTPGRLNQWHSILPNGLVIDIICTRDIDRIDTIIM